MLQSLSIKNYALIQELVLEPSTDLTIITGETGAGKSIMLGALGLLMGKRADTKVLFNSSAKCIIEGTFLISEYKLEWFFDKNEIDYDPETIVRREISPSGKSRAFLNDTPVTLDILKGLSGHLMDIHSQHETLQLTQSDFQIDLLDAFASILNFREEYTSLYNSYTRLLKKLAKYGEEKRSFEKEADYKQFILQELEEASLVPNEVDELESIQLRAEHAEEIKTSLQQISQVLQESDYSSISSLNEALQALRGIKEFDPELGEAFERLNSAIIEIKDITRLLENQNDMVDFDPEEAQRVTDRLSQIYHLQQKHHVSTTDALIKVRDQLRKEVDVSFSVDKEIEKLTLEVEKQKSDLHSRAEALSKKRSAHCDPLAALLTKNLQKVGIPDANVKIEIGQSDNLSRYGLDNVTILFSANRGIAPQPVAKAASGGEFSRLMFCVKHILADKIALPTIVFDEIDTGVSGEVAIKMGDMMKFMASNHQVISISHLPQIAARAERHYVVYKTVAGNNTISNVKLLSDDERVVHIARMIGGNDPTETALENARELLSHG